MSNKQKKPENGQPVQSLGKLGIALSEGGIRATATQSGRFSQLAQNGLLESTSFISSVSVGSLAAGLVYGTSGSHKLFCGY